MHDKKYQKYLDSQEVFTNKTSHELERICYNIFKSYFEYNYYSLNITDYSIGKTSLEYDREKFEQYTVYYNDFHNVENTIFKIVLHPVFFELFEIKYGETSTKPSITMGYDCIKGI